MITPIFETHEDVAMFLRETGDAWCQPMVEEFIEMCGSDLWSVDIKELNELVAMELRSVELGYEQYLDNNGEAYV